MSRDPYLIAVFAEEAGEPPPVWHKPTRGGPRKGAGRKSLSGEKRARVNWTITPTAEARVVAAAAVAGVSPSELVERWAMSLTPTGSPPHSTATTAAPRSPGAQDR